MKPLALIGVVVLLMVSTAAAQASDHQSRWSTLSPKAKRALVSRQIAHDRAALKWWLTARDDWKGGKHFCPSIGIRAPGAICLVSKRLVRLLVVRANLAPKPRASGFPPHHRLWLCLSGHEGGVRSINPNGHYGMLQMHADWGYGTSHHASDDPQTVQEWAAERAYRSSGFSRSFLFGQWITWDGATECLAFA